MKNRNAARKLRDFFYIYCITQKFLTFFGLANECLLYSNKKLAATTQVEAVQLQRSSSAAGVGRIATDGRTPDTHPNKYTHTHAEREKCASKKIRKKKRKRSNGNVKIVCCLFLHVQN